MAETSDGSAALTAPHQPSPQERAARPVPRIENMDEQPFISANPTKKRKEVDGLADQEEDSEEIPEAQATKRQRREDEMDLSPNNNHDELDRWDATIADLQAKLDKRDREMASLREHKNVYEFWFDNCLPKNPAVRKKSEDIIRLMANAEPPREVYDVPGHGFGHVHGFWNVLPPRIRDAKTPRKNTPQTEFEMVLKLQACIVEGNFADALPLISALATMVPHSRFHQISAAWGDIYRLALKSDALASRDTWELMVLVALRELGLLVHARFGLLDGSELFEDTRDRDRLSRFDLGSTFYQAVCESERANHAQLAGALAKICIEKHDSPYPTAFYHEEKSNTGWLSRDDGWFLLIDFNKCTILLVDRLLCSLALSPKGTGKVDLHVKSPCKGDEEMVLTLPQVLGYWLGHRAGINMGRLDRR